MLFPDLGQGKAQGKPRTLCALVLNLCCTIYVLCCVTLSKSLNIPALWLHHL